MRKSSTDKCNLHAVVWKEATPWRNHGPTGSDVQRVVLRRLPRTSLAAMRCLERKEPFPGDLRLGGNGQSPRLAGEFVVEITA